MDAVVLYVGRAGGRESTMGRMGSEWDGGCWREGGEFDGCGRVVTTVVDGSTAAAVVGVGGGGGGGGGQSRGVGYKAIHQAIR